MNCGSIKITISSFLPYSTVVFSLNNTEHVSEKKQTNKETNKRWPCSKGSHFRDNNSNDSSSNIVH